MGEFFFQHNYNFIRPLIYPHPVKVRLILVDYELKQEYAAGRCKIYFPDNGILLVAFL